MNWIWSLATGLIMVSCMVNPANAFEPQLSPLAPPPNWDSLDAYQETITRGQFEHLLSQIYSVDGGFLKFCDISDKECIVYSDVTHTHPDFTLRFAESESATRPVPTTFQTRAPSNDPSSPLKGLTIALDPGHIGGDWAKMEERYFKIGDDPPVEEGQLNEITCGILADLLEADGAKIVWVKHGFHPVTDKDPDDLTDIARADLIRNHRPTTPILLKHYTEQLFYRTAEIRARADVQRDLHPDLTICVHYNADDWGNPDHPVLTARSRLVIFVNGSYEYSELKNDDMKADLLRKLLDRTGPLELKGCTYVGAQMIKTLGFPPESSFLAYSAHQLGPLASVYSRNLMAGRLYHGPVIYCEGPYMNARDAYYRIIAGDYLGTRQIHGGSYKSIYREYATAVEKGVRQYFGVQ